MRPPDPVDIEALARIAQRMPDQYAVLSAFMATAEHEALVRATGPGNTNRDEDSGRAQVWGHLAGILDAAPARWEQIKRERERAANNEPSTPEAGDF